MRLVARQGWGVVVVAGAIAVAVACAGGNGLDGRDPGQGGTDPGQTTPDGGGIDGGGNDGGGIDGGGNDGGGIDGGGIDGGGIDGGPDAGPPPLPIPTLQGWQFYNWKDGLSADGLMGISADEGGNVWVAAGRNGVYVQRGGSGPFQKFGLADGLHPYGYLPDGSPADKNPYLNAISISGGPAGTAYVGYQGREYIFDDLPTGAVGCEGNWDGPNPDPAVYKSGDADKVTLIGNGISVVHYDIFSGPGVVGNELRGREKLCSVKRIVWDGATNTVWFGANHGYAMGDGNYSGNPTCNGQYWCSGLKEHGHPAVNGKNSAGTCDPCILLTADYNGVAVDPITHDVWFGGMIRTTKFRYWSNGGNWDAASKLSEGTGPAWNRVDIWPDAVPDEPLYSERVDDMVSAAAAGSDGSVWMSSIANGLAHIDKNVVVDARIADTPKNGDPSQYLTNKHASALAYDLIDGSLWVGYGAWGGAGGLSRMRGGKFVHFDGKVIGPLANSPVSDIQIRYSKDGKYRLAVLVAFEQGVIGVYSGP